MLHFIKRGARSKEVRRLKQGYSHVYHDFSPVYDNNSTVLILGSFPSVKSREEHFYYGNPKNRFWNVLSSLTGCPRPQSIDEKTAFLLSHGIAVWDVIKSCDIIGSSDSSIRNVVANDISIILGSADIRLICGNGATACRLYDRFILPDTGIEIHRLPSTSPANAARDLDSLVHDWGETISRLLR